MVNLCKDAGARRPVACLIGVALSLLLALPPSVAAEPPPWAPAWGYRAKNGEPGHGQGRVVRSRNNDDGLPGFERGYGIPQGECHREALGAIAGGALGGLIGSRVGDGDGETVAVIAGTLIGMFVGSRIGRQIDQLDERCIGQVLERAPDGQAVTWRNADTGAVFEAEPRRTFKRDGRYCRDYLARVRADGDTRRLDGTACRYEEGVWRVL